MSTIKCHLRVKDRFRLYLIRCIKELQKKRLAKMVKKLERAGVSVTNIESEICKYERQERELMNLDWELQIAYVEEVHRKSKSKENDILIKHKNNENLVQNAKGVRGEVDCLTKNLKKFY